MIELKSDRNTEAEYSIIGAFCIDSRCIERVQGKISSEDFTIPCCGDIFDAASDAISRGKAWDAVMAVDAISRIMDEPEARRFIVECMDIAPTTTNVELHAEIVHKHAEARRLREAVYEALSETSEPQELAGSLISTCRDFLQGNTTKRLKTLSDALVEMYDEKSRKSEETRIDTGFPRLDGILKGIWGGNLCIIGARPGVGKSAFALDLARTAARNGKRAFIYSFEMMADEVAERLISASGVIKLDKLIDNDLSNDDWRLINSTSSVLSRLPIVINDSPRTTVADIRAQARMYPDLKLIIVDYLTLIPSDGSGRKYERRDLEVSSITRRLKNLASELKIPIIALSQLNREFDEFAEPSLRALRESGGIEQDANKVIFLWHIDKEAGIIGVKVAKNRRGKTGTVQMQFEGEYMRYTELSGDCPLPKQKKKKGYRDVFGEGSEEDDAII